MAKKGDSFQTFRDAVVASFSFLGSRGFESRREQSS